MESNEEIHKSYYNESVKKAVYKYRQKIFYENHKEQLTI